MPQTLVMVMVIAMGAVRNNNQTLGAYFELLELAADFSVP